MKSASNFVALLIQHDCDFEVSKLIRLTGDMFFWSSDIPERFWEKVEKIIDK